MADQAFGRVHTRIVRDIGSLGPELEIEYDGTEPPTALFAALESLGWVAPVPVPPPASAIDWSTPDPRTGTRYSLRSYRAVGRARPGAQGASLEVVQGLLERALAASDPTPGPHVVVRVTVPVERGPFVLEALATWGIAAVTSPTRRIVRGLYRGRPSETEAPALRLEMRLPRPLLDSVTSVLGDGATDFSVEG